MKLNKNLLLPLGLVLISVFFAVKSYQSATHLVGWDSIHSEFDFSLAVKRMFFGVWREDQGLGAIAAHSHMADFPRVLFLWLESFVLPTSFLRYSYFFLCLILGPLGMYYFLGYVFTDKNKFHLNIKLASFIGAFAYLLNLVTLQHFFVPFEMFAVQFAFLPFLFSYAYKFLKEGGKLNLVLFCLVTILSSPQAYASVLFWAYFFSLFLFLFVFWLISKQKIERLKRTVLLFVMSVALNLYWMLPNAYSVLNQSETIANSTINRLFSPEAFIRNSANGDYRSLALGKNFLFDWRAYDFQRDEFTDLMADWDNHLSNSSVEMVGLILFYLAVIGLLFSLIRRDRGGISLFFVLFVSVFFLTNLNSPLGFIYSYLYNNFSIFGEALRMPFTKFSLLYQFSIAFFVSYFIYALSQISGKRMFKNIVSVALSFSLLIGLFFYVRPLFGRGLISRVVKNDIPESYFELFNFFKGRIGRVAELPAYSQWGWFYNDWGYEGSGFVSFGLNNPYLNRDYDRWSSYNESFYNQLSHSLYKYRLAKNDEEQKNVAEGNKKVMREVEAILKKYQVSYLLLDESVINPGGKSDLLFIPEIKDLEMRSETINKKAQFGFLTVYEVTGLDPVREGVWAPGQFRVVDANTTYSRFDPIYLKFGNYITDGDTQKGGQEKAIGFPFVNFDPRGDVAINTYTEAGENGVLAEKLVFENKTQKAKVILPVEEKIDEQFGDKQGFGEGYNCDLKKIGSVTKKRLERGVFYGAYDGGVECDYFYYPGIDRHKSYVLRISGENLLGRGLKIYLQNLKTGKMDLEELLPTGKFDRFLVILPTEEENDSKNENPGYTLNVETRSFGQIASENIVNSIAFYPFDIAWMWDLKTQENDPPLVTNGLEIKNVQKYGTGLYLVEAVKKDGESNLLVLGQGFDRGWIARNVKKINLPYLNIGFWWPDGDKRFDHVKVNGWANGWELGQKSGSETVLILFWPQLMQWGGMILISLTFAVLAFGFKKK